MRTPIDHEAALSDYFEQYVTAGKPGGLRFSVRHPKLTAQALQHLRAIPALPFSVAPTAEGSAVERAVFGRPGWKALRSAVSVLSVPSDGATYMLGSSKQTVRRKSRAAERAGAITRRVDDPAERVELLRRADDFERLHARPEYRNADADNSDLLRMRLWIGAFSADGEPLMLSVTPFDGVWASLNYFRTFSENPAASDVRYLMTKVLVEHLSTEGVQHLADTVNPAHLQNGLRHFQRMVGFRIHRVVEVSGATHEGRSVAAGTVTTAD